MLINLYREREKEPRFAPPGSFEYEFGMRWKQLDEMEHKRIEQVKKDTEEARIKLEDEMQNALYEYQAEQIRQGLLLNYHWLLLFFLYGVIAQCLVLLPNCICA